MKFGCVTSIRPVGCTFVDWSLYYLSNQHVFYRVIDQSITPIVNNPILNNNAHGHAKNHPCGLAETTQYLLQLSKHNSLDFCSIYPFPMKVQTAVSLLGLELTQLQDSSCWNMVMKYIADDYQQLINYCCSHNVDTIYIDPDPDLNLYFLSNRSDTVITDPSQEFQNVFFSNSIAKWHNDNLSSRWDHRERMALDLRPFDRVENHYQLNFFQPHLRINSSSLWNHGEDTIRSIMEYLNLKIDKNRWDAWLPIHQQWHNIQQQHLEFAYKFDHIMDSIINNYHYVLGNLSLLQEATIQHALIYQHNLNLKTWQLEKFPANTKDLHLLLEPNIHII